MNAVSCVHVQPRARVPVFDFMRGLAVLGFMLWHAFDMFYVGNKYDEPLFRATILTRISFVMVSGLVLGLKDWSSYRITDHLGKAFKLMSFTFIIGICYAFTKGSLAPVYAIFLYVVGGPNNFTFSILISIGVIYIFVPFFLKIIVDQKKIIVGILLISLFLFEIILDISLPEIVRFILIALLFSILSRTDRFIRKSGCMLFLVGALFLLSMLMAIFSEDIYWYIRNYFILQVIILVLFYVALYSLFDLIRIDNNYLVGVVNLFGENSLFVYIFHYIFYLFFLSCTCFSTSSSIIILLLSACAVIIFYFIFQKTSVHRVFAVNFR